MRIEALNKVRSITCIYFIVRKGIKDINNKHNKICQLECRSEDWDRTYVRRGGYEPEELLASAEQAAALPREVGAEVWVTGLANKLILC